MQKLISLNGNYEKIEIDTNEFSQIVLEVPHTDCVKSLDVILNIPGADVEVLGVFVGTKSQKINLTINSVHKVPNTKCLVQIRGVLFDAAYSSFKGMIKIEKNAQQTNSYLDDDVLILGVEARNQSEPGLEIEADDVKATHGATTGIISEEHLFYLQSRGLTRAQAQEIIIEGFLEPVISKIIDEKIRAEVYTKIRKQLYG